MKRAWLSVCLFLVLVAVLALPRLVVVPKVARGLEEELAVSLRSEELTVAIQSPLGWELLLGRIPGFSLSAKNAVLAGVTVARVEVEGQELLFEPWTLFRHHELILSRVGTLNGTFVVTEDALNEVLWQEVDPSRRLWLEVSPAGLWVAGTVNIWNMELSVRILGDVVVENGTALRYVAKDLTVQEARVPSILLELLKDTFNFAVDFGPLPLPVQMEAVEYLEHEIKIRIGGRQ